MNRRAQLSYTVRPVAEQIVHGLVEPAQWDDPDDTGRRGSYSAVVVGWRRADPILALHRRSPRDVTADHVRAVERLRDDYEIGEGARGVGRGAGGGIDPTEAQIDAAGRYRAAVSAVGPGLCDVLIPVALAGWTVHALAERRGISDHRAAGMLIGALIRLRDHYDPPVAGR